MSELKFRAWSNEYDHYCSGLQYDSDFGWEGILESEFEYQTDTEPLVELYTGLKDKNGKEIYEGDVVNIQGIRYYVDFEHGGFWFNNDNRKWKANRPFTHFQEVNDAEVIGNIHENPELLEGEK